MSERIHLYPPDRSKFLCPECKELLPVDHTTKCQNCGVYLEVRVKVDGK